MIRTIRQDGSLHWDAKGTDRIAQNVRNLLCLTRYEVAYNRILGLPPELPDQPAEAAARQAVREAKELILRFEPRARVLAITPVLDGEGNMTLEVTLEVD